MRFRESLKHGNYWTAVLAFLLMMEATFASDQPAVSATHLASLRDIGGHARGAINLSPDGLWVVFQLQAPRISEGDYELSWMALSTRAQAVARIADGGDILLNPALNAWTNGNRPEVRARWSPDSKSFAYLVRRDGQTQIWQSRPDRKGQVQLTHNAADVIDFDWSSDGSRLYFTTGRDRSRSAVARHEEGAQGFLYDDRFDPQESLQPRLQTCRVASDGQIHAVSLNRDCDLPVWVYDPKNQVERQATPEEAAGFFSLRQGPNAPNAIDDRAIHNLSQWGAFARYAWLENEDPDTYAGVYAPLTLHALIDGTVHRCTDELCRTYGVRGHQDLWWHQDGEEVIFLRRSGGGRSETGLYAWQPSTGKLRTVFRSNDLLSDCAATGGRLLCLYESWTRPRTIAEVSFADGAVEILYDPNPEFTDLRFTRIDKFEWRDAFGNPTYGHLVYPIDHDPASSYPLVIVTYQSRGFLRGGIGDEYPIHPLAAEGFFVLSHEMPFDLEGVAKAPNHNLYLHKDEYMQKSVLSSQISIVDRLAESGLIDETRVAITGLSQGAMQVYYGLIHSEIFAAAIASSADISHSSYYILNKNVRDRWRVLMNGSPDDPNSGTHSFSIGLNVDRVDAPLLVNVSDEELIASIENFVRLKHSQKPVEMYVYPGEHHIKWRPEHRLAVYRRNIQWLKFWLLGEIESDPVSPGQYERWSTLCKLTNRKKLGLGTNFISRPCARNAADGALPH